jgi:hypothetical protein
MKKFFFLLAVFFCWSEIGSADRAPVSPPNAEVSPGKNQRSNDDVAAVLKSCLINSGAASSPEKSRTLKTADSNGQISEDQFLRSLHGRVLQNLKNLEGDQCSRFVNEVASRSKALRELRACAGVQLSLKHSAKPEASAASNPLHDTQSLGFDVICEKSSTKDALAVHQFGSKISKEEKEISMTESESVVWCNNFKKSVGGQLSALRKDIDRLQRQQAQGLAASSGNSKGDFYRRFSDLIESAEHAKRKECLQVGDQLTQENPLLKHIKNHPATSAEILAATKKCTAETKDAQTQFAKMDLTKKGSDVQALALLDPVVAEEIKAHPESCASYLKVRKS